ncbi:hypothetical protein [Acidovorax sp.]|uniref:hypothetical protein n=1 Tax=Acidovorax sp. TaxID=1872122 RepID=UPI00391BE5D4
MSEAIKPPARPWVARGRDVYVGRKRVAFSVNAATDEPLSMKADVERAMQMAAFIAEAGTVHHETGLTPRQLVERVKELEDTLDHMAKSMTRQLDLIAERAPGAFLDKQPVINTLRMHSQRAQKALSKSLPNTVAEVKE